MPLYVGDYLADTTHLTCTEHGAYLLLLMAMWRAGGSLPNDDARLARFARCTKGQWERMRPVLIGFFQQSDDVLTQGRMARELTKHSGAVEQRRQAGSNGGKAKAAKYQEKVLAGANLPPKQPKPEPIDNSEAKASSISRPQPKPNGFARFWEAYPNKTGKGAAETAYAKALKRIDGPDPPAVLLAALERVKPTWRDRQFIPNPTTWLNQDRWEDQPETVVPLDVRRDRPSAPDRKLEERHDNYRRSFAGAVRAAEDRSVG